MRIDASNGFSGVAPTTTGVGTSAPIQSGNKSNPKIELPPSGEDSTFTPTQDLARLLAAVRAMPDVRPDVVQNAREAVASGELLSPVASADTAQAILSSNLDIAD